jgi:hypothetical protein
MTYYTLENVKEKLADISLGFYRYNGEIRQRYNECLRIGVGGETIYLWVDKSRLKSIKEYFSDAENMVIRKWEPVYAADVQKTD